MELQFIISLQHKPYNASPYSVNISTFQHCNQCNINSIIMGMRSRLSTHFMGYYRFDSGHPSLASRYVNIYSFIHCLIVFALSFIIIIIGMSVLYYFICWHVLYMFAFLIFVFPLLFYNFYALLCVILDSFMLFFIETVQ